jgi:hypothetical protein
MQTSLLLALTASLAFAAPPPRSTPPAGGEVVVTAGPIYVADGDRVFDGGAKMLIRDG